MERKFQNPSQTLNEDNPELYWELLTPTAENYYPPDDLLEAFLNTPAFTSSYHVHEFPCKRGRKRIRPDNPTKTEIMDKFWIRGFKEFMKLNLDQLKPKLDEWKFWEFFLGRAGDPGKKRKHLSYGREFKKFLYANRSFCKYFIAWAVMYGNLRMPKKNFKGSWELYFSYLCTEMMESCKGNVDKEGLKESMELLSTVYFKYLKFVSRQINILSYNT